MICVTFKSTLDITESSVLYLEFMGGDVLRLSFSSVTNGCYCHVWQYPSCTLYLQIFPMGVDKVIKLSLTRAGLLLVPIRLCDRGGAHALERAPYWC